MKRISKTQEQVLYELNHKLSTLDSGISIIFEYGRIYGRNRLIISMIFSTGYIETDKIEIRRIIRFIKTLKMSEATSYLVDNIDCLFSIDPDIRKHTFDTGVKIRTSIIGRDGAHINYEKNKDVLIAQCRRNCEKARLDGKSGWVTKDRPNVWNKGLTKETDNRVLQLSLDKMGSNNPMFGVTPSEDTRNKLSIAMKSRILSGDFTPNIHNSNTHWTATYKHNKFRSSLEAAFYCLNETDVVFEKTRISYKNELGIDRIYIIDFTDDNQRILYEIKPTSSYETNKNECLQKEKFAIQWADKNGYTYKIIDQYFVFDSFDLLLRNKDHFSIDTFNKIEHTYETCKKNRNKQTYKNL